MAHFTKIYLAKIFHSLVNTVAALFFVTCLSYGAYGLWDTVAVLRQPETLARKIEQYRPDIPGNAVLGGDEGEEAAEKGALEDLLALNPDVAGWITIDGTNIDYPLVQGEDNFEYLHKDIYGQDATAGSIFLDYENNRDFTDFYSILMGHHMQNGKMFGDVERFTEEAFFREHTTGTLCLNDRTLNLETVAVMTVDAYDQTMYRVDVVGEESKRQLLDHVRDMALYQRGGPWTQTGQYLALSTCSSEYTNARYILILKVSGEN